MIDLILVCVAILLSPVFITMVNITLEEIKTRIEVKQNENKQ